MQLKARLVRIATGTNLNFRQNLLYNLKVDRFRKRAVETIYDANLRCANFHRSFKFLYFAKTSLLAVWRDESANDYSICGWESIKTMSSPNNASFRISGTRLSCRVRNLDMYSKNFNFFFWIKILFKWIIFENIYPFTHISIVYKYFFII